MSETKYVSNIVGHCPKCNQTDLDYAQVEFEGNQLYFPYVCRTCGFRGYEWYLMDFATHYNPAEAEDVEVDKPGPGAIQE